ncbi:MAG: DUF3857 and transglutaminase domain-containing protein [Acidobacteriota bacterium]|nr:DUF3857 and transglutaminase domain-containing protein [Acidobacteriota bacterium]
MILIRDTHDRRTLWFLAALLALASPLARAQWTQPTPEELSMTSQPEVPGAPAVYLFREEITDDDMHMYSIYVRLKVLTEGGKENANVTLNYQHTAYGASTSIENVEGRTIHADGTVIPFTGKPYDKLVEKTHGLKFMEKVFTLPDVAVGSIIEYRYKIRYGDNYFIAPSWYIQSNLFTRKSHYMWKPTDKQLITDDDRGQLTSMIFWTPVLPPGTVVKQTTTAGVGAFHGTRTTLEVNAHDTPPIAEEDFMPPLASLSYRVMFYYSPYRNEEEYWQKEGKHWAKLRDKFIGPGSGVIAAVHELTASSDTEDQKLRKLYAAVMKLENTSYTRQHTTSEEKSQGLREVRNTDDIWARKRGNNDDLTALFVAMARAAGSKAYLARITSRDHNLFLAGFLNLSQLDDDLAIINIDGKEQFFDPGARFCPYGHLAWKHTMVQGIRQTDGASAFVHTPGESYQFSHSTRTANLTLNDHGEVSGNVTLSFEGSPALTWRQRSLEGDSASLEREMRTTVEKLMPQGVEVKVASIEKLDDYEQPLVVHLDVSGTLGSSTGKRLLVPADLFESNEKPTFPNSRREIPVMFESSRYNQDAIRIRFPAGFSIESLPLNEKVSLKSSAICAIKTESTPTSFTFRRDFVMAEIIFPTDEYADLRSFYSKVESKDQESVVLTAVQPASMSPAKSGN